MEYIIKNNDDELMHYGVLGMKRGVRRYQNKDGSLTSAGKKHTQNQKSDDSDNEKRKLTDKQKKAIIAGSVAVAASLAVIGVCMHIKRIIYQSM